MKNKHTWLTFLHLIIKNFWSSLVTQKTSGWEETAKQQIMKFENINYTLTSWLKKGKMEMNCRTMNY